MGVETYQGCAVSTIPCLFHRAFDCFIYCFLVATMSWMKRPEPYQEFIDKCKGGAVLFGAPWNLKIWETSDSEILVWELDDCG